MSALEEATMKGQRTTVPAAGFTLVELAISTVLLGMMVFAVSTLAVTGSDAQELSHRLGRATELTQDMLGDMHLELVASVRVFGTDAEGTANLAMLDLTGAPVRLGNMRLPTIDAGGQIRRDTSTNQITGNTLFFAKHAWSDRYVCAGGDEYMVDVYRWIYYYLTPEGVGPQPGSDIGLDLVRFVGEPLVDGGTIDRITDANDKRELLLHLHNRTPDASGVRHEACQVVWNRGGLPSVVGTFRQINPFDGSLSNSPLGGRPSPWSVLPTEQTASGLFAYRHYAVATNFARPAFGVCKFAVLSPTGDGFPHGFEVQVTGPSSARQVMLKLVTASTHGRGHTAWSNLQMVVDAHDL
jgi:hypothetical protein